MNNNTLRSNFWGYFVIALAIVIAAAIASGAVRAVKRASDTISVTGSARMRVSSDFITWRGTINENAPTLQKATEQLQNHRGQIQSYFKEKELPDDIVSFMTPYNYTTQEYNDKGMPTGKILGYQVNQEFVVRSDDIDLVTKVAEAAESLMLKGIPVQLYSPEYYYNNIEEARIGLMEEATRDALKRAEKIASAANGKIGSIRNAKMGVIQVVPPNSTMVSDYGMYDTSTREKDIVAVVRVTFGVK